MSGWSKSHRNGFAALYGNERISDSHKNISTPKQREPIKKIESERKAQQRLVFWLYEAKIPYYAIPNGANVSPHHRAVLLSEGMSPGVPDLCIPRARGKYHGLYIELKREDGGSGLSDEQRAWLERLRAEGYCAVQCNGFDKAVGVVEWYMGLEG